MHLVACRLLPFLELLGGTIIQVPFAISARVVPSCLTVIVHLSISIMVVACIEPCIPLNFSYIAMWCQIL